MYHRSTSLLAEHVRSRLRLLFGTGTVVPDDRCQRPGNIKVGYGMSSERVHSLHWATNAPAPHYLVLESPTATGDNR
jgi:hypothetical protein